MSIQTQNLFFLGFGGVGRALARQIMAARERHEMRNQLRLEIVGIADSAGVVLDSNGICDATLVQMDTRKTKGQKLGDNLKPIQASARSPIPDGAIVVDTTATDATVPLILEAKSRGCGVVLANKLPLAGSLEDWDALTGSKARWETTCGAALPVISTLNTLLNSGDTVTRIEGALSGTLGYLSGEMERGTPFGEAVRVAKQLGFTEPDPRQDLGGKDVARKALILARMLGYRIGMADVQIESLYPAEMDVLSVEEFLREVDTLNEPMAQRAAALTAGGEKLRYAASIENGICKAGLMGAAPDTKLGSIRSTDSIVAFTTTYFSDNPLAVSGRGAGQDVTASGVLGDIVSLAQEM